MGKLNKKVRRIVSIFLKEGLSEITSHYSPFSRVIPATKLESKEVTSPSWIIGSSPIMTRVEKCHFIPLQIATGALAMTD
jgi:hypothetical protein